MPWYSGCSSLSPDQRTLAIAMQSGYDTHRIDTRVPLVLIPHDLNAPGPIAFVHNGQSLLGPSRRGEICLWNSADGEKLQTIKQSGKWRYPDLVEGRLCTEDMIVSDNWCCLAVCVFPKTCISSPH